MLEIEKKEKKLGIISKCTKCGAPIYGSKTVKMDEELTLKFSCSCRFMSQVLAPVAPAAIYIQPYPQPIYIQPYIPQWISSTITCENDYMPTIVANPLETNISGSTYQLNNNIQYSLTSH
jgi:hypothetical protein